jgi:hypothetical protein
MKEDRELLKETQKVIQTVVDDYLIKMHGEKLSNFTHQQIIDELRKIDDKLYSQWRVISAHFKKEEEK